MQRRTLGQGALDPSISNAEGVGMMQKVRGEISAMIKDEDGLLASRLDGLQRARKHALWFQNVAGLVSLVLLSGVFLTLVSQMLRASRAEQEAQRSNTQLREANNEMRAFSYSVAHDLRLPLRAIHGFAQTLVEECGDELGEPGRQTVARITGSATTMAQLIDDLLALSKISYQPLRAEKIDMTGLARDAFAELRETQHGRVVNCVVNELPRAFGDPALLRQVWLNLISNSLKFSAMREKIEIEIGGNVAGPEFATYYIKDNGAGFDMQHATKLFGAFQRLHQPGEFAGTGIGLAWFSASCSATAGRSGPRARRTRARASLSRYRSVAPGARRRRITRSNPADATARRCPGPPGRSPCNQASQHGCCRFFNRTCPPQSYGGLCGAAATPI